LHVADLIAAIDGNPAGAGRLSKAQLAEEALIVDGGSTGTASLDAQARASYRQRLADLRDVLEEAERRNDFHHAAQARAEIEFLSGELASAYGMHGARSAVQPLERKRKAVGNRIRAAIARLRALHPVLGRHLANAVRLGAFCTYRPDPLVDWDVTSR
jgi:hypothetical protein